MVWIKTNEIQLHNLAISTNTTGAPNYRLHGKCPNVDFYHVGDRTVTIGGETPRSVANYRENLSLPRGNRWRQLTLGHRCMTSDSRDRYDEGVSNLSGMFSNHDADRFSRHLDASGNRVIHLDYKFARLTRKIFQ